MKVKTFDIGITIEAFSEESAIEKLQAVAKEMKEGARCCSAHPARIEPYLPYIYYSCHEHEREISEEWLKEYTEEEIKKMRFEEVKNAKKTI